MYTKQILPFCTTKVEAVFHKEPQAQKISHKEEDSLSTIIKELSSEYRASKSPTYIYLSNLLTCSLSGLCLLPKKLRFIICSPKLNVYLAGAGGSHLALGSKERRRKGSSLR